MWEENEEGTGVRMRSCLVPHGVLFEMRWVGGLSTQTLDTSLPHSVEDESPWQFESLIGA